MPPPPPRIRPAPAAGPARVAAALAAGGGAAGLVRYVLQQGRAALSTEVMEALLQLFVGLAAALAAVLVASGSHAEAEAEAVAPAAAALPAPTAQQQPPAHQEEKEGAAATGDNGAADGDEWSGGDDDDGALDESAAPLAPAHFVAACKGDVDKAQRRWDATRRWRREEGIDRLLFRPNTTMELARKYYPLWFHGRGRQGEVVLFEMAGQMDMTALKAEGLRVADLARHSTYLQEFMWEVLTEGHPEGRCLTVMDLGGMCLPRLTSSDTAELIRTSSGVLDAHYPGRISRILVVNAPGWVARVWSVIAGLMPQTLREKIHVTRDLAELREFIDPAQLPTSYGGTDPTPPGQSAEERLLQEMVAEVRAGRRPPALRALHARRRAAKAAASTAGAGAGVTAAGGEEAAAAMVAPPAVELALPSSARPAGGSASGSSAESPPSPATWPAAAPDAAAPPLPAGKKGRRATKGWGGSSSSGSGKPPTPFRARSPFARAWFANRAQQQQEQWPASMSLLRVGGSPASWPPQGQAGEENGSKQRKEDAKVLAIPSRSPPSGSGSSKGSKGSKGFWRRRGRSQTPSPRVEAPVPSPAS